MTQEDHNRCAVFDLDGTLLSADSTVSWLKSSLRTSRWRLFAGVVVLPVAIVLVSMPKVRRYGASMLLWIATFGFDEKAIRESIDGFVRRFEAGHWPLRWYGDAITMLEEHMRSGDRVVVVTAAPQWLAERILAPWTGRLHVIGSSLGHQAWGWVFQRHCRADEKCRMLSEAGYGDRWHWAYSDNEDDAPILAAASQAFLINASEQRKRRADARGANIDSVLTWR